MWRSTLANSGSERVAGEGGNGSGSGNNPTDIFLLSMSRQNFQAILNAVFKMEQYWAGVTGVSQLLEKSKFSCIFHPLSRLSNRGS